MSPENLNAWGFLLSSFSIWPLASYKCSADFWKCGLFLILAFYVLHITEKSTGPSDIWTSCLPAILLYINIIFLYMTIFCGVNIFLCCWIPLCQKWWILIIVIKLCTDILTEHIKTLHLHLYMACDCVWCCSFKIQFEHNLFIWCHESFSLRVTVSFFF